MKWLGLQKRSVFDFHESQNRKIDFLYNEIVKNISLDKLIYGKVLSVSINTDSRVTLLPELTTGAEIRAAINAGKEVTFHEKQTNAHGWKGFGYIILDPETGAGAYLIEGGGNGGWFLVATVVLALLAAATYVVFGPFAVLGWGWFLLGSLGAAVHALDETNATVKWGFVWAAIGLGLGIISIPGLFALTAAAAWGVWGLAFYSAMITIYEFL